MMVSPQVLNAYMQGLRVASQAWYPGRIGYAITMNIRFANKAGLKARDISLQLLEKHNAQKDGEGNFKFEPKDGQMRAVFAVEESRVAYEQELQGVNTKEIIPLRVRRVQASEFENMEQVSPALLQDLQPMLIFDDELEPEPKAEAPKPNNDDVELPEGVGTPELHSETESDLRSGASGNE